MGKSVLDRSKRSRFRRADAALLLFTIGVVTAFRHAGAVANALNGALAVETRSVWNSLWLITMACLVVLTYRLLRVMGRHPRGLAGILSDENASVTVDFVLTFPPFLLLLAMIVQMALLANAALVVDYAAYAAARSAIVGVPMAHAGNAREAAYVALAPISPPAGQPGPGIGEGIQPIIDRYGKPWAFGGIQARTAYAAQATKISVTPDEIIVPEDVTVRLQYPFALRIPGAAAILASKVETIGGVSGRFFTLSGTCTLRSTGAPYTEWWRMLVAFGDYFEILGQMYQVVMALYELGSDTIAVIRGVGGGHVDGPGGTTLPVPSGPGRGPPPGGNIPRMNLPYPPSRMSPPRPPPLPSAPGSIQGIRMPSGIRGLLPPAPSRPMLPPAPPRLLLPERTSGEIPEREKPDVTWRVSPRSTGVLAMAGNNGDFALIVVANGCAHAAA